MCGKPPPTCQLYLCALVYAVVTVDSSSALLAPLPPDRLELQVGSRGQWFCCHVKPLLCQQPPPYSNTPPRNRTPLRQAGRIDLWLPRFYRHRTVFKFSSAMLCFFCLMKVLPLDFFFRLLLCRSFRRRLAPFSRGPSVCLWGFSLIGSTQAVNMGREGWGGGGCRGSHIQGCTLMITIGFFFPFERVIFVVVVDILLLLSVFNFTAPTAIPIASSELWQIKLCLHQTCFFICIHRLI